VLGLINIGMMVVVSSPVSGFREGRCGLEGMNADAW
jgi:hypothetical protein